MKRKPNKTKRGEAIKYAGLWENRTYVLTLTGWSHMTGINRNYFEHRIKRGQDFQSIIDERAPKGWQAIAVFLYAPCTHRRDTKAI